MAVRASAEVVVLHVVEFQSRVVVDLPTKVGKHEKLKYIGMAFHLLGGEARKNHRDEDMFQVTIRGVGVGRWLSKGLQKDRNHNLS